jgi:hypothetical protein
VRVLVPQILRAAAVAAGVLLASGVADAQGTSAIAGVVHDTSGAVLPGVTVEASSPALIEKTRTVVTDSEGQYKIVDLPGGTYTVTFALTGFSTVKRDGLVLTANFTANVTAEMRVGALEERSPFPDKRRSSTCRPPRSTRSFRPTRCIRCR